jgi:hypothetical protein
MLWPIILLTSRTTVSHLPTFLTPHQLSRLPAPLRLITSPRVTQHPCLETSALALFLVETHIPRVRKKPRDTRREIKLFGVSDHAATVVQAVSSFNIKKGAIWRWAAPGYAARGPVLDQGGWDSE